MDREADLFDIMKDKFQTMSKGHKKLTEYIMNNFDKAVFMTASMLGKTVGISESTVVRYAAVLGYKGYPEFQEVMTAYATKKLSSIEKIDISTKGLSKESLLHKVMESDLKKIQLTMEIVDEEIFNQALDIIDKSKRIYICGVRSCSMLAEFLAFYLRNIYDDVRVITTNSMSEMLEQTIKISEKDCFIGISFPRYSMRVLKIMEYANHKSAKVIAITDSISSPMCLYSSCNLIAKSDMTNTMDSLVAPLSLINSIIVGLSIKNNNKVLKNIREIEDAWDDYQVYEADEINKM